MKDTLKELLVECLNAGKKGSKSGVDPSMYPSQVNDVTFVWNGITIVYFLPWW